MSVSCEYFVLSEVSATGRSFAQRVLPSVCVCVCVLCVSLWVIKCNNNNYNDLLKRQKERRKNDRFKSIYDK